MKRFTFCDGVSAFCSSERADFHMPGHKGRLLSISPRFDTTELCGTDNLYNPVPGGTLQASLSELSALYGTEVSIVLAGGTTLSLLAAVHSAVRRRGKKILAERKIHRSIVYAFAHCAAEPVWLYPDADGELPPKQIAEALARHPDAAALVLTSPDYYGCLRDLPAIASAAYKAGVPVIVDGAHGAHLDFWQNGSLSPVGLPGTIVAQSLHKTLPALTGAALLHSNAGFSQEELLSSVRAFSTSSPSYLISLSAFDCVSGMRESGSDALAALLRRIDDAKRAFSEIGFSPCDFPLSDPFRIAMRAGIPDISGHLEAFLLREGVVCEFSDRDTLVLIPSVMNTDEDFAELRAALKRFGRVSSAPAHEYPQPFLPRPRAALSIYDALLRQSETVPLAASVGRIASEPVSPYPPGIALMVPGEVIEAEMLVFLDRAGIETVQVIK